MSKKTYSPLTPEQIIAQMEADKAIRQNLPEAEQFNSVEQRAVTGQETFSKARQKAFEFKNGKSMNVDTQDILDVKLPSDVQANINKEVEKIPDFLGEYRQQMKETLTRAAIDSEKQRKEAQKPAYVKRVKERFTPEVASEYEENLEKKRNLESKTAATALKNHRSPGALGWLQNAVTNKIADWIPETWGLDEKEKLEYNKAADEVFKVDAILAEEDLKRDREDAEKFQQIYDQSEGTWNRRVAKTALELKQRSIGTHEEFLNRGGFWSKLNNHTLNIGSAGAVDAIETLGVVLPVALKAQENPESLSEEEKVLLQAYAEHQATTGDYYEKGGFAARLGDGMGHSLSFLTSMMVTGPIGGGVKAGITKTATKQLGRKIINNSAKKVAGAAINATGEAASLATQVGLTPGSYSQIAENMIGIVEYDRERNKIMLNEQIYEDFVQENKDRREIARQIYDKYNAAVNLDGLKLSPEEEQQYQDAKARLGLPSTSDLKSFDELEKEAEKMYPERMSTARAIQHGYTATLNEIVAERYIGKGLSKLGGKIFGDKFAGSRFGRKYRDIERAKDKLMSKIGGDGLIQDIPSEFMEEVLVSPLHAVNDWSTQPLEEWKDFNTTLEVGAQTILMGGAFRGGASLRTMYQKKKNPEFFKDRKEIRKQFDAIKYAENDEDVNRILDTTKKDIKDGVENTADIVSKRNLITKLEKSKNPEDRKRAKELERKMFSTMLGRAFQTGTLTDFAAAMEKLAANTSDGISDQTRQFAVQALSKIEKLQKKANKYNGLLNSKSLLQRESMVMSAIETRQELSKYLDTYKEEASEQFNEFISKNKEFENVSIDDIIDGTLEEEQSGKLLDKLEKENYEDAVQFLKMKIADNTILDSINQVKADIRKESSPEFQARLKEKLRLENLFRKNLNEILEEEKIGIEDINENIIEYAMQRAFANIGRKNQSLLSKVKRNFEFSKHDVDESMDRYDEFIRQGNEKFTKEEVFSITSKYDTLIALNNLKKQQKKEEKVAEKAPAPKNPVTPPEVEHGVQQVSEENDEKLKAAANNAAKNIAGKAEVIINNNDSIGFPEDAPEFEGAGGTAVVDVDDPDTLFFPGENNLSAELRKEAVSGVKEFYDALAEVFGRTPSFQEFIAQSIKYNGKETTKDLFPAYAYGWEQNKYAKTDFDKVYDDAFDPLKDKALSMASRLMAARGTTATPQEVDEQHKTAKEQIKEENAPVVARDNEGAPVKRPKFGGFKVGTVESKLGFNAVAYDIDYDPVTDTYVKKSELEPRLNLTEDSMIDFRELLHPEKFVEGDVAKVAVVERDKWSEVPVLIGYDADQRPITISFKEWYDTNSKAYEKANPDKSFEQSDDFINKVPIVVLGSENQPVAFVHDTDWYNERNVADPESDTLENELLDEELEFEDNALKEQIKLGKENVSDMRKRIVQGGVSEIVVKSKTQGIFYQRDPKLPELSVAEANPDTIIAVLHGEQLETGDGQKFEVGNRVLLNKPSDIYRKKPGSSKLAYDGYVWGVMRVGTRYKDGVKQETYRAFLLTRKNDQGDFGIKDENLETLRYLWAAQARLQGESDVEIQSIYNQKVKGTKYDMSIEEAEAIREKVMDISNVDILNRKNVSDFMKIYGVFSDGTSLSVFGKRLYEKETTSASLRQNTDLNFLGQNIDVVQIGEDKVPQNKGKYTEMLKRQLTTKIQAFNVGTQENPVYTAFPQPVITYGIAEDASTEKQEVNYKLVPVQAPAPLPSPSPVGTSETVETQQEETKEDLDTYLKETREFFENELQITFDENLGNNEEIDELELPGDLTRIEKLVDILGVTENLTTKQEAQVVDFLFNNLLLAIDAKYATKVNKAQLMEELKNSYQEVVGTYKGKVKEIVAELGRLKEKHPEDKRIETLFNNYYKSLTIYDSMLANWDSIKEKAVEKATRYTEIKNKESQEDDDVESDTSIRDHGWNSKLEETGKDKTTYQLKRFMAGIPNTNPDGSVKRGFLGIPLYIGFDDVYNSVSQFFSGNIDIPADYNEMIERLREMESSVPWVSNLVKNLEAADEQIKNQFVVAYTKHSLNMKFVMYNGNDGSGVSLDVYDTNANEVSRQIIEKWRNILKTGQLINNNMLNKEYAQQLLNKYQSLGQYKHKADDEDLREFLSEFGLEVADETWDEFKKGRFYNNNKFISFSGLFSDKSGLFAIMEDTLMQVINTDDKNLNIEENPEFHPYLNMSNALRSVAKIEANYVTQAITLNFRDNGKTISGQTPGKFATDRISELKRAAKNETDKGILKQLLDLPLSSQNTFLRLLNDNPDFREKFGVSHIGITAFKEMGKKASDFNALTSLNDMDHDYVKLGLLQDRKQGEVKKKGGIPMRMAKLFFPTMSDKDQMLLLHTAVYDFASKDGMLFEKGKQFHPQVKRLLFEQLVLPEIKRIVDFHMNVGSTDIKDYDNAAQIFNFIPALNNVKDEDGTRAIEEMAILSEKGEYEFDELIDYITAKYKDNFTDVVEDFVHNEVDVKRAEWDKNLIERNTAGEISKVNFNKGYLEAMGTKTPEQKYEAGVYDYVLNSIIGNHDIFTAIGGDPALYSKNKDFGSKKPYAQSDSFYADFAEKTGVNIGKRLALLIAPGNKIAGAKDEKYHQLFLKDASDVSENIDYLIRLFYGKEALTDEVKKEIETARQLKESKARDNARDFLAAKFPQVADYLDLESTDAQEYTTMNEHLHVMFKYGRLSKEQYDNMMDKVKKGETLTKEDLSLVMQPIKPVYTGQVFKNGVARTVYIKSSSFPLIPQLTAGTQLDALRVKMEQLEKKYPNRKVRASYQTANKVGAMGKAIDITDPQSLEAAEESMLELDRNNFRIQQDVPFKSDKKGDDSISMGTQIFKLLFGDGMMDEKGFVYNGNPYTGRELYEKYNKVFHNLVKVKRKDLFNELGLDNLGNPINPKNTALRLQKLLKEEALKRNYPLQDIQGLELQEIPTKNGEPYYEFITPLWLASNSNRYESLLNAIVAKRLMQHKIHGNSFVAGSEHGLRDGNTFIPGSVGAKDMDSLSSKEKSRIVRLGGWNGQELKATRATNKAQVMIPSKFKDNSGKLVNLFEDFSDETGNGKYIERKEDGSLGLKEGMIDESLFNLFSFRTPTSSHVSASSIEVVGILPPESGDLMIVPKNFTKQKGLDYDVDKENTYALHHVVDHKTGKIEVLAQRHKEKRLKGIQQALEKLHLQQDKDKSNFMLQDGEGSILALFDDEFVEEVLMSDQIELEEKMVRVAREFDKKILENEFIKIHLAVFNNPADGVQQRINKVLSMDFAREQANKISEMQSGKKDNKYFSILSDQYQKEKMGLGAAGKMAIGVYSNYVTLHAMIQQSDAPVQLVRRNKAGEVKEVMSINIGNFSTAKAKIPNTLGNVRTLDGSRSIAEVFAERQNTATDNEKEQILGRVNVNSTTIGVDSLLTLLGFDKDEQGNSIPYMLLSQPIIRDYVKMLSDTNGITSSYNPNREQEIINTLLDKYNTTGSELSLSPIGEFVDVQTSEDIDWSHELTGKQMEAAIKADTPSGRVQLAALSTFLKVNMMAKELSTAQKVINSKDLGKSIVEANTLHNNLEKLGENKGTFNNIHSLVGEFRKSIDENTENYEDYVKIGQTFVRPTTPQGQIVAYGIHAGNNLWKNYFPYSSDAFQDVFDQIMEIADVDTTKAYKVNDIIHDVVKDVKKYIYSAQMHGIFTQPASEERRRLFIDEVGKPSLASYLHTILRGENTPGVESLKSNRLISKLTYDLQTDGRPSTIRFNNTSNDTFDEEYLYTSIPAMISDNIPLPNFQGRKFTTRDLAKELVTYAYVEGGIQEAIQFIKYVPVEYLEAITVTTNEGVKTANELLQKYSVARNPRVFEGLLGIMPGEGNVHQFVRQYIQHNPQMAKQYPRKEAKKLFKNIKTAPGTDIIESFTLNKDESPQFIARKIPTKSKKTQDKWKLYEHKGNNRYERISVLGIHGMNEYEFRNVKDTRPVVSVMEGVAPTQEVQQQIQAQHTPVKAKIPFNIQDGDSVKTVLQKMMNGNMKQYAHLAKMAEFLLPLMDESTVLKLDNTIGSRGKYRLPENTITLNDDYLKESSEQSARVMMHEFIHSVTHKELLKYYESDGVTFRKGENGEPMMPPKHIADLNMVFRQFREQYTPQERADFKKKLKDYKEKKMLGSDFTEREMNELYPTTSIFEFVSVMMTEPSLQEKMMGVKYKQSKDSIFDRFVRAISNLVKAIHPNGKGDSITEHAMANIIKVIQDNKKSLDKKRNVAPASKEPPMPEGDRSQNFNFDVEGFNTNIPSYPGANNLPPLESYDDAPMQEGDNSAPMTEGPQEGPAVEGNNPPMTEGDNNADTENPDTVYMPGNSTFTEDEIDQLPDCL